MIILSQSLRKFFFTTHIIFSVGWFGALASFLVLNIAGVKSIDPQVIRGSYVGMYLIGWFIILPACLGSLLTGLIQTFATHWGLFKHWWIIVKFILTVGSTALLLLHMQQISAGALMAFEAETLGGGLQELGMSLLNKAVAAFVVLLFITIISVYKPWGQTPYGLRKQKGLNTGTLNKIPAQKKFSWKYFLIGLFILIFIIRHLAGPHMSGH